MAVAVDEMVKALLDTIVENLRIELGGPSTVQPGQALAAAISAFPQTIQTIKFAAAPFKLDGKLDSFTLNGNADPVTRVSKKVQYKKTEPEKSNLDLADLKAGIEDEGTPEAVLPTGAFASVPGVAGLLEQVSALAGKVVVPELKGLIEGALTIPVPLQMPISTQVTWKVLDEAGKPLEQGRDYLAPAGVNTLTPTFILRPPIISDPAVIEDPSKAKPMTRLLRATVTLSADTYTKSRDLDINPVLTVLPLLLPLGALFSLSLDSLPEPGVPSALSLVRQTPDLPRLPEVFEVTWQKVHTNPAKLPIPLEVQWTTFQLEDSATGTKEHETDPNHVKSLSAAASPLLSLLVQPNIVEMAEGRPPIASILPDTIYVRARIRVAVPAGQTEQPWLALPAVPVPVPTIAVPTVLALFNHAGFSLNTHGGIPPCALVVVPNNSLLRTAQPDELLGVLRNLVGVINKLTRVPVTLPILSKLINALRPLEKLVDTLTGLTRILVPGDAKGPKLRIWATEGEEELSDIVFFKHELANLILETANDAFGSLIFMGPPGKSLRFYNNEHFDHEGTKDFESEGAFNLRLPGGEMMSFAALIESLHGDPPATFPAEAYIRHRSAKEGSFGDRLSSFRFLPKDWIQFKITDFQPRSGKAGTVVSVIVDHPEFVEQIELNGTRVEGIPLPVRRFVFSVPPEATSGHLKLKFRDLEAISSEPFTVTPE